MRAHKYYPGPFYKLNKYEALIKFNEIYGTIVHSHDQIQRACLKCTFCAVLKENMDEFNHWIMCKNSTNSLIWFCNESCFNCWVLST